MKKEETILQSKCFKWFNNNYCLKHHSPRLMMVGIQNEILSSVWKYIPKKVAMIMSSQFKSMGQKVGVSDSLVYFPNKIVHVEFKSDNGTQSEDQKEFEKQVSDLGFEYHICRSLEEFKIIVNNNIKTQ